MKAAPAFDFLGLRGGERHSELYNLTPVDWDISIANCPRDPHFTFLWEPSIDVDTQNDQCIRGDHLERRSVPRNVNGDVLNTTWRVIHQLKLVRFQRRLGELLMLVHKRSNSIADDMRVIALDDRAHGRNPATS